MPCARGRGFERTRGGARLARPRRARARASRPARSSRAPRAVLGDARGARLCARSVGRCSAGIVSASTTDEQAHSIWYTRERVSCDYTTVGHVTVDVMADGSRRPGGGAFYSALQAARLGWRARDRHARRARRDRAAARALRRTSSSWRCRARRARRRCDDSTSRDARRASAGMLAWAGEIGRDARSTRAILHVAPVARETRARWRGRADFVGADAAGPRARLVASLGAPVRARARWTPRCCPSAATRS